jgi:hypothetical protein
MGMTYGLSGGGVPGSRKGVLTASPYERAHLVRYLGQVESAEALIGWTASGPGIDVPTRLSLNTTVKEPPT